MPLKTCTPPLGKLPQPINLSSAIAEDGKGGGSEQQQQQEVSEAAAQPGAPGVR